MTINRRDKEISVIGFKKKPIVDNTPKFHCKVHRGLRLQEIRRKSEWEDEAEIISYICPACGTKYDPDALKAAADTETDEVRMGRFAI